MAAITFAQQDQNKLDADLQRILALLLAQEKEDERRRKQEANNSNNNSNSNTQKDLLEKLLAGDSSANFEGGGAGDFGSTVGGSQFEIGASQGGASGGSNFGSIFGGSAPAAAGSAGSQSSTFGGGTGLFNAGGQQVGGGGFSAGGEAGGSAGGGGAFSSAGSSGSIMAMILATAIAQGAGDRQPEGSFLSRFQEGALPSPAKNLGLTEGSEFNAKEFGIGTFLPFLNFFREPNTPGQEDGGVILQDLGLSEGQSGNNRNSSGGGGFLLNLFG